MRWLSLVFAALGAGIPAQQAKVVPAGMDQVEGQVPLGLLFSRVDADFLLLYDGDQITTGQAQLTGIDFRRCRRTLPVVGFTKPYRVTAYTVPMNAAGMIALGPSVNIASIVGSATGTVVFQGPVTFPAHGPPALAPAPFDINFAFSVPCSFDAAQGNLLLRIQATDSTAVTGTSTVDTGAFTDGYGIVTDVDPAGCPRGATSVSLATAAYSVVAGQSIDTTLTITPGVGALFVALSLDRADLDLAPFGMPGCASRVGSTLALQTVLPVPPLLAPHALWPIPANPAFIGMPLFTQAAALSAGGAPPALSNTEGLRIGASQGAPTKWTMACWTGSLYMQFSGSTKLMPVVRLAGTFP
jgi:hypothetical protein